MKTSIATLALFLCAGLAWGQGSVGNVWVVTDKEPPLIQKVIDCSPPVAKVTTYTYAKDSRGRWVRVAAPARAEASITLPQKTEAGCQIINGVKVCPVQR